MRGGRDTSVWVLHRAPLLLWLAEPEGEPLRINRISIESGLTGVELATPLRRSVKLGVVLRKLIYGLNTAMFESRRELPGLTTGNEARGVLTGAPRNGTGHRIPCDKFSRQRTLWALLRDVSARWAQLTRRCLKHDSTRGAGNGTGWPLMETLGTQVSGSPLTSLLRELHRCRLPKWATLLLFFFCPPIKPRLAQGRAIFSRQGGEIEMRLLRQEVLGSRKCLEWRATCEQYPPGTISATSYSTGRLEITNDNAWCTKCINVY